MGKLVYFLSDFHLGAKYFSNPLDAERRVVRFLDSIKESAADVYLLGDILDYWYEYRYVVPRGFTRFFGKLAELSDAGVKIHWFIGNHDIWIFDYLPSELGIEVIDGSQVKEILGRRFYLAHGDGVGQRKRSFLFLRAFFRNRFCQVLFAAIHPRWTIPFALNWSLKSRKTGAVTKEKTVMCGRHLRDFALEYSAAHRDVDYFVFGHIHEVTDELLNTGAHFVVLGDWINLYSYATFDGESLQMNYFEE